MRNNAIIVKIVESEVDFRVLHCNDWMNLAMQLICKALEHKTSKKTNKKLKCLPR